MLDTLQTRTGLRALMHFQALSITPYTPKLDAAHLRRAKARNHPKANRKERTH